VSEAAARALPYILVGLAAAALIAYLGTPVAGRIAMRLGAVDRPGARRIHARPIPRAGGLAVGAGFLLVGLGLLGLAMTDGIPLSVGSLTQPELAVLFGGTALAMGFGFIEDVVQLRARWQLVFQFVLAMVAVVGGVTIGAINNPFGGGLIIFATPFAVLFTILWIVGMINSINFIDGLDGLSSGVSIIAALTLGVISMTTGFDQPEIALLCAILAGSLLGFLPRNFHPAHIFIGTTGVYLVGFALAVLSILGTAKVAVALLVLGVPIIDTFWIIVRRLLAGQSPFTADRGHLHHRLLDLGLGHREAVLAIYAICGVLAVLSLVLSGTGQLTAFVGVVVVLGAFLFVVTRRTTEDALEASTYDEEALDEGGSGG
jgi:UDP-GlcNAc:undecaprenyl-phosphate/decaprenyl-phosphate GlcNAc-1-phosphate transferase